MSSEKFIKNKTVLITLVSACLIVIISLGIRKTFGMFYFDFSTDLGITLSQFGFALGLQMLLWGVFGPWFGVITDKYGHTYLLSLQTRDQKLPKEAFEVLKQSRTVKELFLDQ